MFNYISQTVPARLALSHVDNTPHIAIIMLRVTHLQEQSETTFQVTIKYSNLTTICLVYTIRIQSCQFS